MNGYYFLASALPPLQIGQKPDIDFRQFLFLLRTNLSPADLRLIEVIQRYDDIQNIRAFWLGEKLDSYGSLDPLALEEALAGAAGLPDYVYAFLKKHERQEERMRFFPELIREYFDREIEHAAGFLLEYLSFEREWRLSGIKTLFESHKEAPFDLHQALCEYRFEKAEEMYGVQTFSIDRILAYMVQLQIVERWQRLDQERGMEKIQKLIG